MSRATVAVGAGTTKKKGAGGSRAFLAPLVS